MGRTQDGFAQAIVEIVVQSMFPDFDSGHHGDAGIRRRASTCR